MENKNLYYINDDFRYYNIYDVNEIDLFCSELSVFCNNWVRDNENLFFVATSPNNSVNLTQEEMNYIYLLDQNCKNFEELDINNSVNWLMENQKNDLLLLDLENVNFLFLIPKFDKNNCYYFDFFISFKNKYGYDNLLNLNFNIISIKNISEIKNLSFLDIKTIFSFEKSKFSNNRFNYCFIPTLNIDSQKKKINITPVSEEEEEKILINFLTKCSKHNNVDENENLKLEMKDVLSQYLKKPDINMYLKKISYFFYWNTEIPDCWSQPHRPGYMFVMDDETGYSTCYASRVHVLCSEFKLNTFVN